MFDQCSIEGVDGEGPYHVKRFRGGLVFKAHRPVYHSTLGLRVIKKKKNEYRVLESAAAGLGDFRLDHHRTLLSHRHCGGGGSV